MSLFGSLMQEMERDPIFGAHHRAMNRMMNSFFGGMGPAAGNGGFNLGLMGPGPSAMRPPHQSHHREDDALMPFGGGVMSPFGAFGGFPDLSGMMAMTPTNGQHAFTSSSFMSFTSGADGRPQVYQSTAETRHGPDGVRETRNSMTDSRSGTKKMAVGRHLGEQSHVVEREQNMRTGQMNENHEYYNLGEEEAPMFDREWKTRAHQGSRARYSHSSSMPAIAAPPMASRSSGSSSRPNSYVRHAPEVVELEDEPYNTTMSAGNQPRHSQSAVTIEELPASDEETEQVEQLPQQTRFSRRPHPTPTSSSVQAAASSSYRRSPHGAGASREKRQKRSKVGKKY